MPRPSQTTRRSAPSTRRSAASPREEDPDHESLSINEAIDRLFNVSVRPVNASLKDKRERWRKRHEILFPKNGRRRSKKAKDDIRARYAELFPGQDRDLTKLGPTLDRLDRILSRSIAGNFITEHHAVLVLRALLDEYTRIAPSKTESKAAPHKPDGFPKVAPELWRDRDLNKKETPIAFTKRVYGRWLGPHTKRRMLRDVDMDLYRAVSVWLHRHPDETLHELQPEKERMNEIMDRLARELEPEELRRLGYAIDARFRKKT